MTGILQAKIMEDKNTTSVAEFILLSFENIHQFKMLLFIACLIIYITCIIGNLVIFLLIHFDSSLHALMYFFISRFAILEIVFVSVIVPKLLDILIAGKNRIGFVACFLQLYCADTTGIVESYFLTVMVFDRHFAITNPLQYVSIMTPWCIRLAVFPWIVGSVAAFLPTIFTATLKFCGPNLIEYFFCDLTPLQNLACSDPYVSILVTNIVAMFVVLPSFMTIIGFYIHIILTILKIKSTDGKQKAFSTCSSHLIVSSLYFCTGIAVYIKPSGKQHDIFLGFIYRIVTPLLNPFIYTFRNREVKCAFYKVFKNLWIKNNVQIGLKSQDTGES
ncbi:olfactory receptor 6N1-like [Dendropsophus ebraccatus]|uniref:olfactory receptor 6N1-like n=1 Tax=Dendropsophus ebraccatus TaxID=150705 RepID=UPI00383148F5